MAKKHDIVRKKGIYVVTYSGVSTIGRNCYLIVKDGRILVIDFGIGFPDINTYNIQYMTPDINWLVRHKSHIDGIVITHAHLDHIGGVPYLLQFLNGKIPIYGSRFTMEFLKEKLKEKKKLIKAEPILNVVDSGRKYKVGNFLVEFAHVTHSIPQSMAVAVNTAYGKIVYTGDYKLDPTPINESPTDIKTLTRWSKEGIIVSLLDSTNAFEKGHSRSETTIMRVLEEIIEEAPGRVIIGMFSSLVSRLIGIIEIAKKLNKKVAFTGRSLETNVRIAMRIGYLSPDQETIIPIEETHRYDDKQLIIIATGSQGEYEAALTRMARSKHAYIRLRSSDTIILSSSVIPTNVVHVQRLMDLLSFTGATFINSKLMDVHVSGHAYQEDMKDMAKLLNSEFYVPVHGYPSFLFQHKRVLQEAGVSGNRIFIPSEGSIIKLEPHKIVPMRKIKLAPQYVVASEILDHKEQLVTDRINLALHGILSVLVLVKRPVYEVYVYQKGVLSTTKWKELKPVLLKHLSNYLISIKKQYQKDPNVLKNKTKVARLITSYTGKILKREYNVSPTIQVIIRKA